MFRDILLAGAVATLASLAPAAYAAEPAPAASATPAATAYTTATTEIGTLLDDEAAKAVLAKHAPQLVAHEGIDQARSMTLKQVQGFAGDLLNDEILARIDADLAKLPPKK